MSLGVGISSSLMKEFDKYEWRATHAVQTNSHLFDGNFTDHSSAVGYNYEKTNGLFIEGDALKQMGTQASGVSMQDLLTGDGVEFGDNISFSFWIKPTWGHTGSNSSCTWTSGFGTVMPLLQINGAGTGSLDGSDRAILMYINSSSSGFRNRFTAWVDDGDDRSGTQRALHNASSVTGTGSGSTTVSLWDEANPGNVNSEGYVHLVVTRSTGGNSWKAYWNGSIFMGTGATGSYPNISVDQGDGDVEIAADNIDFLGIGTYRAKTSSYDSGNTPYNYGLASFRIRDFAIFNSELSAGHVNVLYNSGNFSDVRVTSSGLLPVMYYPLNHNLAEYMGTGLDLKGNISFASLT